jgi:hypothetical protein
MNYLLKVASKFKHIQLVTNGYLNYRKVWSKLIKAL